MRLKVVDLSPLFPKYSSLQTTFSLYSVPVFPLGSDFITKEPYMSSVPPHPIRTEHIPLTSPEEAFLRQHITSWPGLLACPTLHTPSRLAAGSWEVSAWISRPILTAPPVF